MNVLGHVIEKEILKPNEDKITAVKNILKLNTKTEVKSFLGLTG